MKTHFISATIAVMAFGFVAQADPPVVAHQHWIGGIDAGRIQTYGIACLETPDPYEPEGPWESRAQVGQVTTGTIRVTYPGVPNPGGQPINYQLVAPITIDNETHAITFNGQAVSDLGDIFDSIPGSPGQGVQGVITIDLDQPVVMSVQGHRPRSRGKVARRRTARASRRNAAASGRLPRQPEPG